MRESDTKRTHTPKVQARRQRCPTLSPLLYPLSLTSRPCFAWAEIKPNPSIPSSLNIPPSLNPPSLSPFFSPNLSYLVSPSLFLPFVIRYILIIYLSVQLSICLSVLSLALSLSLAHLSSRLRHCKHYAATPYFRSSQQGLTTPNSLPILQGKITW